MTSGRSPCLEPPTRKTPAMNTFVARTILSQIGGNRALMMIGATKAGAVVVGDNCVTIATKGCRRGNRVKITLDPSDTYTVSLLKQTGGRLSRKTCTVSPVKVVETRSDVYNTNLVAVIEAMTELYLSL